MKTILLKSQKGGSGKTTLSAHLAVEAERQGDGPAWIVDTDKQATLSQWHDRRPVDLPQRLDSPLSRLKNDLEILSQQGATYCFIDTAPTISKQGSDLLQLADLVVIPVRPSPADLWSVAETVEEVKDAKVPFLFVLTQAKPQANLTAQSVAALSAHGQVAESFVCDRVIYAAAMTGGQAAQELSGSSPASQEISALWMGIKSCFHEKRKSRKRAARG